LTAPDANSFKKENKHKTERIVNIEQFANRHFYADFLGVCVGVSLRREFWHSRCFMREIEVGELLDVSWSNADKKAGMAAFGRFEIHVDAKKWCHKLSQIVIESR
jgi:hypothetical protein